MSHGEPENGAAVPTSRAVVDTTEVHRILCNIGGGHKGCRQPLMYNELLASLTSGITKSIVWGNQDMWWSDWISVMQPLPNRSMYVHVW